MGSCLEVIVLLGYLGKIPAFFFFFGLCLFPNMYVCSSCLDVAGTCR